MTLWQLIAIAALADADEIGHKCESHDCMEIARWRIFWPGQPGVKCTRHRDAWMEVAVAIGFELRSEPIEVRRLNPPPPDDTAERFAAMEIE